MRRYVCTDPQTMMPDLAAGNVTHLTGDWVKHSEAIEELRRVREELVCKQELLSVLIDNTLAISDGQNIPIYAVNFAKLYAGRSPRVVDQMRECFTKVALIHSDKTLEIEEKL